MTSTALFKPGISSSALRDHDAYIMLSGNAGTTLNEVILARAPLSSIEVEETVNVHLSGAMNNDVLVTAFGQQPVKISIRGMEIYGSSSCPGAVVDSGATVSAFYKTYNIHNNVQARVDLSIGPAVYTCVLVALAQGTDGSAQLAGAGASKWGITLVGLRL